MEALKSQLELNPLDVNVTWMNPEAPRLDRARTEAARLVQASAENPRCQAQSPYRSRRSNKVS